MIIKPPHQYCPKKNETSIFLAGSIEMGKAENWQEIAERELDGVFDVIFNPRRDDWDTSWEQKISNPKFNEQVNWELDYLQLADVVLFYFAPDTMSPVTLLELGLMIGLNKKIIVVCPDGFWRKGNVDITCEMFCVDTFDTLEHALNFLKG